MFFKRLKLNWYFESVYISFVFSRQGVYDFFFYVITSTTGLQKQPHSQNI